MSYMTMEEQIASHLKFLKQQNFAIEELYVDGGFVRCCAIDQTVDGGEFCYQTQQNQLRNGMVGLATWCRGGGGQTKTHKTYGLSPQRPNIKEVDANAAIDQFEEIKKAEIFWQMSDQTGEAEYLLKKGVGYYGIRFRRTDYGKVAVIPMGNIDGKLLSYQLINPDGTKRFSRNVEIKGLLHMLHKPIGNFPIGLAESYVTAATCFELTGMAMVTAFSANNLKAVGIALRRKYPNNPIIVFGDNDRHLEENTGMRLAHAVKEELGIACCVAVPDFDGYPTLREFSDWNDLVWEIGIKEARLAMRKALDNNQT
ncbi:MAG: toprim domain-containing protein [Balneolaceae bacterium]